MTGKPRYNEKASKGYLGRTFGKLEITKYLLGNNGANAQTTSRHFVYTEGVRSSSLLPPKAFEDQANVTCY
jgi:hypothetical protein